MQEFINLQEYIDGHPQGYDFDSILISYLSSQISLEDAITRIVTPIEAAYTKADIESYQTRGYSIGCYSPDHLLMALWYSIFMASKSIPYATYLPRHLDQPNNNDLISLITALQIRPSPSIRADKLEAAKKYGPWALGNLLGNLVQSDRKASSITDGHGPHGCSWAATIEWINISAFVADLCGRGIYGDSFYWIAYAPDDETRERSTSLWVLEPGAFGAVAVWIILSAEKWWEDGKFSNKTRLRQWRWVGEGGGRN